MKTLPYSEDAEQAVLSAAFMDVSALAIARTIITPAAFYRSAHAKLFAAMAAISDRGEVPDPVTLSSYLEAQGELDAVGGKDFIGYMVDVVPTAANVEHHAKIVRNRAERRNVIAIGERLIEGARDLSLTPDNVAQQATSDLLPVAAQTKSRGFVHIGEVMISVFEDIMKRRSNDTGLSGITWGYDALDFETGGIREGELAFVCGVPGCLADDTFIQYQLRGPDGRNRNDKGGTIARLYERFHKLPARGNGRGAYARPTDSDSMFYAPSMNGEGRIVRNAILDVVYSGMKECFRVITESGMSLDATAEHKFWTGSEYRTLADLSVGDLVYIHIGAKARGRKRRPSPRKELSVKHHPITGTHIVAGKYEYHRIRQSRAVVEAQMNNLSFDEYIARLNGGQLAGLTFLPREQHVHHVNENCLDDAPGNLAVLFGPDHNRQHATEAKDRMGFKVLPDPIVSIESVGLRPTYDICMAAPHHNFVANRIVVHNSGKTAAVLNMATRQSMRRVRVAIVSAEMGIKALVERILNASAGINSKQSRKGEISDEEWNLMVKIGVGLKGLPLTIDDTAQPNIQDVVAKCRAEKAKHPDLKVIVVDFIQLLQSKDDDNRSLELTQISYALKGLAKELEVAIIVTCQVDAAAVEKTEDKQPRLHHLRWSQAMREAGDFVCLIKNTQQYDPSGPSRLETHWEKARELPVFHVYLRWIGSTMAVDDMPVRAVA